MNKKLFAVEFTVILSLLFSGCNEAQSSNLQSSESDPYPNLNISDAIVTTHTPTSNEWKTLQFDYPFITSDTFHAMQQAASGYNQHILQPDNAVCSVTIEDPDEESGIRKEDCSYSDMTAEQYTDADFMRYFDDEFYMDFNGTGKIELYNKQSVKDILNVDWDGTWSWRPYFNGSVEKTYDLDTDEYKDAAYTLDGEPVTINTALQNANAFIGSGNLPYICTNLCTYQPIQADVYRFDNGNYGYYFTYQLYFDEVPMDVCQAMALDGGNVPIANTIKLLMLTDRSVDWIWTCAMNQETPVSESTCTLSVDFENACTIVSQALSQEYIFTVKDVELLYCMIELRDSSARWGVTGTKIEPMWQFHITNIEVQEYSTLYVDVSAVTGEVFMRYE